jgi:hypothetical protein
MTVASPKTVGQIALDLGVGNHRVEYVIRTRKIAPALIVGNYRAFDAAGVRAIAAALAETEARRRTPVAQASE